MEKAKINFTNHEVNELIGNVPKNTLVYCLAILIVTLVSIGFMLCLIPYPKNMPVEVELFTRGTFDVHSPKEIHQQSDCKLYIDRNKFNESYFSHLDKFSLAIKENEKLYHLSGSLIKVSLLAHTIIADVALKENNDLLGLLKSERSKIISQQFAEMMNESFTIKDKLCTTLY